MAGTSITFTRQGITFNTDVYNASTNPNGLNGEGVKPDPVGPDNLSRLINTMMVEMALAESELSDLLKTTSATSHNISQGSKAFVTSSSPNFEVNDPCYAFSLSNAGAVLYGTITAWDDDDDLTINVTDTDGSGTNITDWVIRAAPRGPIGLNGGLPPSKFNATAAPTANDDDSDTGGAGVNFEPGSLWLDTTTQLIYCCFDATTATAVWKKVSVAQDSIYANRPFELIDADQTFALSDANSEQILTGSTSREWTIPANATVPIPIGSEIDLFSLSTGTLTLTAAGGVTINGITAGGITIDTNNGGNLKKILTDTWRYAGQNQTEWST